MNKSIMITVILVVVVGSVGFFAGIKYQQSQRPNMANRQFNGQGRMGASGINRQGFSPVNGDIISSDDKSITVKLADGSSKIVLLSNTTVINKADTATVADLKIGEKVAAFGTTNTDGSVTASSIQLNPMMRGNPNNIQPSNQPNPSP